MGQRSYRKWRLGFILGTRRRPSHGNGHRGHASALAQLGIRASCKYGQALGEANGHYEETNSASWDLAEVILDAVGNLTGDHDPTQVNPDFPGWWRSHLPPGRLP